MQAIVLVSRKWFYHWIMMLLGIVRAHVHTHTHARTHPMISNISRHRQCASYQNIYLLTCRAKRIQPQVVFDCQSEQFWHAKRSKQLDFINLPAPYSYSLPINSCLRTRWLHSHLRSWSLTMSPSVSQLNTNNRQSHHSLPSCTETTTTTATNVIII